MKYTKVVWVLSVTLLGVNGKKVVSEMLDHSGELSSMIVFLLQLQCMNGRIKNRNVELRVSNVCVS